MDMRTEILITSNDILTVGDAAKELGQHRSTIYRWLEAGKFIGVKLGGILFVPKSEVERLKKDIAGATK